MLEKIAGNDALTLVLVNLSVDLNETWLRNVHSATTQWSSRIHTNISDAKVLLKEDETSHLVLIYRNPSVDVAQSLQSGVSPSEALLEWESKAAELASIAADHSSRVTFVQHNNTPPGVGDFLQQLDDHLDSKLPTTQQPEATTLEEKDTEPDAVYLLAANAALQSSSQAGALSAQLGDNALAIGHRTTSLEAISTACAVHRENLQTLTDAMQRIQGQASKVEDLAQENTMLIKQLLATQEEAERAANAVRASQGRVSRLLGGIKKRDRKIAALRRSRKRYLERSKQLEEALKAGQSSSPKTSDPGNRKKVTAENSETASLKREVQELKQRNKDLSQQIRRIKSSRSWKYTKVLRQLNGTEAGL